VRREGVEPSLECGDIDDAVRNCGSGWAVACLAYPQRRAARAARAALGGKRVDLPRSRGDMDDSACDCRRLVDWFTRLTGPQRGAGGAASAAVGGERVPSSPKP